LFSFVCVFVCCLFLKGLRFLFPQIPRQIPTKTPPNYIKFHQNLLDFIPNTIDFMWELCFIIKKRVVDMGKHTNYPKHSKP
jgi:hypothetical protein